MKVRFVAFQGTVQGELTYAEHFKLTGLNARIPTFASFGIVKKTEFKNFVASGNEWIDRCISVMIWNNVIPKLHPGWVIQKLTMSIIDQAIQNIEYKRRCTYIQSESFSVSSRLMPTRTHKPRPIFEITLPSTNKNKNRLVKLDYKTTIQTSNWSWIILPVTEADMTRWMVAFMLTKCWNIIRTIEKPCSAHTRLAMKMRWYKTCANVANRRRIF